jgi:osmoprotectant transport system substrate-binding protein
VDRTKTIGGLTLLLLVLGGCSSSGKHPIRVGSKNFTEQVVLGEIIAQHLEHRHLAVERRLNLGGTLLAHEALMKGDLDLYPEYTGTALAAVLKDPIETEPSKVLERVRSEYSSRFKVDWLDPLGVDDSFAMVVSGPEARSKNLETLSDAAKRTDGWNLGVGYEFEQRADGLAALNATYKLRWTSAPKSMDLGLLYKALEQNQVTMIAANATDGLLSKLDVKVLTDDQHAFPPYQVCIAVRQDSLRDTPGLREALLELSGKLTNQRMRELNYQVDGEHQSVAAVAAAFLRQSGLE